MTDDGGAEYLAGIHYEPIKFGEIRAGVSILANIVVIAGSSEKWVIFGDREFEVAIIATDASVEEFDQYLKAGRGILNTEDAQNVIAERCSDKSVSEEILKKFRNNYINTESGKKGRL